MNGLVRKGRSRQATPIRAALRLAAALVTIAPAWAGDDQPHRTGLLDSVLETLNFKTKVGPMPGFVEATRPDPSTLHYIPTGRTHPKRSVAVETPDQVEATKQALDKARDGQLNPKPAAPKPAAGVRHPTPKAAAKPDDAAAN